MSASLPAQFSRAAAKVLPALSAAAERTGVDFAALFHTARLESGFNPQAKASTSSATGLFQFIDSSWLSTLARHGPRHGISAGSRTEALALRKNPEIASLMAAEHMADNKAVLEARLGREASSADLYLAHFLGAGGALKFLSGLAANPAQAAAEVLPAAARANRAIFFQSGAPRSLASVQQLLENRFAGTNAPHSGGIPGTSVPLPAVVSRTRPETEKSPPIHATPIHATPNHAPPNHAHADTKAHATRLAAQVAYLLLADLGA